MGEPVHVQQHNVIRRTTPPQRPPSSGEPPEDYVCPISLMVMEDPVMIVQSGITYEREVIEEALRIHPCRDPKTNQEWSEPLTLAPNVLVRKMIIEWQERQREKARRPPPPQQPDPERSDPSWRWPSQGSGGGGAQTWSGPLPSRAQHEAGGGGASSSTKDAESWEVEDFTEC